MSQAREPMKPALGLVRDRVSTLPSRRNTAAPAAKPAETMPDDDSVEAALATERAKEAAYEAEIAAVAPAEATATHDLAAEAASAGESKPRNKRSPRSSKPIKASEASGVMKRTTLSLPQALLDLMTERRGKVGQVQFILNALAQTAPRLKELVAAENGVPVGNELFPVRATARVNIGKLTTITFDTVVENMKVVDELVEKSGAASRSQLVRVALRDVLGAD